MGGGWGGRFPPADRQVWFRAGPEAFAPSDSFVPTHPGPKRGSGSGRRWGHGLGASVHLEGPRAPNTFPRPCPRAAPALADASGLVSPQDWPGRASAAAPVPRPEGFARPSLRTPDPGINSRFRRSCARRKAKSGRQRGDTAPPAGGAAPRPGRGSRGRSLCPHSRAGGPPRSGNSTKSSESTGIIGKEETL